MNFDPKVTILEGTFGGGNYPLVPATVRIVDFSIPEGHHIIAGKLYRTTFDWKELRQITLPDGSHPTACALVPVEETLT